MNARECPLCGKPEPDARFDFTPNPTAIYVGECSDCYYSGRRVLLQRAQHRAGQRAEVFNHYGWSCACCGTAENPTVDHVNGDGREHRQEVDAGRLYAWLIRNRFPDGFQTLCRPCNTSKSRGEHCRLHPLQEVGR